MGEGRDRLEPVDWREEEDIARHLFASRGRVPLISNLVILTTLYRDGFSAWSASRTSGLIFAFRFWSIVIRHIYQSSSLRVLYYQRQA